MGETIRQYLILHYGQFLSFVRFELPAEVQNIIRSNISRIRQESIEDLKVLDGLVADCVTLNAVLAELESMLKLPADHLPATLGFRGPDVR